MKKLTVVIAAATIMIGSSVAWAAEPDPSLIVGSKKCGICHKKDETGNQLGKWKAGPHANAIASLKTDQAKEIGKKMGIDDPAQSGKCLKCHSTAYYFTEKNATETIAVDEGVSCESCHGPGKKYMPKSVMESREKSIANGLIYPATQNCTKCHNQESPTFKGFDEKKYWEKIAHPNPAKK